MKKTVLMAIALMLGLCVRPSSVVEENFFCECLRSWFKEGFWDAYARVEWEIFSTAYARVEWEIFSTAYACS